jgi:hypothetical protein
LKKKGLKAGFYYGWYDNDPDFGQIRAHIEGCRPRCVGFTVYGSNLPETVALSRVIKKAYPHIPILWGGRTSVSTRNGWWKNILMVWTYASRVKAKSPWRPC